MKTKLRIGFTEYGEVVLVRPGRWFDRTLGLWDIEVYGLERALALAESKKALLDSELES